MSQSFIRTITLNDILYLRQEDVVRYFLECSEVEETDVRNRFVEAAKRIAALKEV